MPWFVSDTTPADLTWSLNQLAGVQDESLSGLAQRWEKYFQSSLYQSLLLFL